MTLYLLDANVFIEAKKRYYGLDFCPAFWDWLVMKNREGRVASIEKVADEIRIGKDDLTDWAKARGDGFFLRPDDAVKSALRKVSNWATGNGYQQNAVADFLEKADYFLVAHALALNRTALALNCTVITEEVREKNRNKIKIPDACDGLGLPCMNTYEMLRQERAMFVLGPTSI